MSVFEDWAIIGDSDPYFTNKGRDYLYRRDRGFYKDYKALKTNNGSDVDQFGSRVAIYEKIMVFEAP